MKVGDLVELSAAGRNTVYCRNLREKTGIVVEINSKANYMYPILVKWFGGDQVRHLRNSLKFVSRA